MKRQKISINEIFINTDLNPRSKNEYKYDGKNPNPGFVSLVNNIMEHGILEAPTVAPYSFVEGDPIEGKGKRFIVISGHRRTMAWKKIEEIRQQTNAESEPLVYECQIDDIPRDQYLEKIVGYQAFNTSFNAVAKGKACLALRSSGKSDQDISKITGFNVDKVDKYISLLSLPPVLLSFVEADVIREHVGFAIADWNAKYSNNKMLEKYVEAVIAELMEKPEITKAGFDSMQKIHYDNYKNNKIKSEKEAGNLVVETKGKSSGKAPIPSKPTTMKTQAKPSGIVSKLSSSASNVSAKEREEIAAENLRNQIECIIGWKPINAEEIRATLRGMLSNGVSHPNIMFVIKNLTRVDEAALAEIGSTSSKKSPAVSIRKDGESKPKPVVQKPLSKPASSIAPRPVSAPPPIDEDDFDDN